MKNLHCESVDRLFQTFLNLQTVEECYAYFEDLCTIKELQDMSQRLDTAILLSQGLSYQKITVSRCLRYGSGGYQQAIDRLNADNK